jgi:S-formylglutathione hydrolase FrmB
MRNRKYLGLVVALIALGAASAFATLQFTNITYWAINATKPPVEKYPGSDAAAYPSNIAVKSYTSSNGVNATYIYILGYTGDITNYSNALKVCNYYGSTSYTVSIQYVGPVGGSYTSYVNQFMVYNSANPSQWVGFTYSGATQTGPVQVATLAPGQCVTLGVSVLVSGSLPSAAYSSSVGTGVPPIISYG